MGWETYTFNQMSLVKESETLLPICKVWSENHVKDAHLISAAPDLLLIAELILKEWEKPTEGVQIGELIARLSNYSLEARNAINKAKGIK